MATVTQSTQEVTPSPSTHRPPGQRALKRMGDRVFSGLSTGSGIIILVILILAVIVSCIQIVQQSKAYVIERLGAFHSVWGVGMHFKLPFIERVVKKRPLPHGSPH